MADETAALPVLKRVKVAPLELEKVYPVEVAVLIWIALSVLDTARFGLFVAPTLNTAVPVLAGDTPPSQFAPVVKSVPTLAQV